MKTRNSILAGIALSMILIAFPAVTSMATGFQKGLDSRTVKVDRAVSGFTALDISSAFHVYLSQGNTESLSIEADEDIIDHIKTEVSGNTLKIYVDKRINNIGELNIYLTFKELNYIELSGAVDLEGENAMNFQDLKLDLSGASELEMDLKVNKLNTDFSGASELKLKGTCDKAYIDASGASKINMEDFTVSDLTIDASGASTMKVNASSKLKIDASGASSIRYKGGATIDASTSGASSVRSY